MRIRRVLFGALALLLSLGSLGVTAPAASAAIYPGPASSASCEQWLWAIDVSTWQGRIDWTAVRARGVALAWIKVTGSDGGNYRDGRATDNLVNATAAGVQWGTYHFASPAPGNATAQADWAISQGFGKGSLWPVLDLEHNPRGMSGAQLDAWALEFVDHVRAVTGRPTIIYSGAWFSGFGGDGRLAASPFWIANYGANRATNPCERSWPAVPNAWGQGFSIWQHNSVTRVDGIAGNVDQNIVAPELVEAMTGAGVADPPPGEIADAEQVVWGPGSSGPAVARIQRIVGAPEDGVYGPTTAAKVRAWQAFLGAGADGYWGPDTEQRTAALFDALAGLPALEPSPPPAPATHPTLAVGARGPDVAALQAALILNGQGGHGMVVDGVFGALTRGNVVRFQLEHGLVPDGVVGPATWGAL